MEGEILEPRIQLRLQFDFRSFVDGDAVHADWAEYALQEAWADFWQRFVDEVCTPRPLGRTRAFTIDRAFEPPDPTVGFVLPFAPMMRALAVHPLEFPDDLAAAAEGRGRLTAPSSAFIAALSSSPVNVDRELFAVGVGTSIGPDGRRHHHRVVEFEMQAFEAWEGSVRGRGALWLTFIGASVLLPMFLTTFGNATGTAASQYFGKQIAQKRMDARLLAADVPCITTAEFRFQREELIADLEKRMTMADPVGICQLQAALCALELSPGQLDGKLGPRTRAAIDAFILRYGLPPNCYDKPVFFNSVARALAGDLQAAK